MTEQGDQRAQTKLALGAMLIPIFFASLFALCIIGTYHRPSPNNIKIGIVGPTAQTAPLRAVLERSAPSAFQFSQVPSVSQATNDVRHRHLNAALIPTASPRQPAIIIVAGASGRLVATAAETLARSVTTAQGTQLVVQDARPLSPGDEIGVGIFLFMIVCTICGYLAATLLLTEAPNLVPARRYVILAAVAVLVPAIAYLIGGLGFGTYTGSVGTIFAFIAVAALYTFVIGLVTRLLQVLFGPPALFLSLAIFIFLNIPSLGATYTSTMLPPFWRSLNHFWLGAETVNAERSILYFHGSGVGHDLMRLFAWAAVAVIVLILPISRKLQHRHEHSASTGDHESSGSAVPQTANHPSHA